MNTGAMWGWIGGIAGIMIGLAGGIVGSYFSIKNTNGPRERALMVKAGVACWVAGAVSLGLMLRYMYSPYRFLLLIPFWILMPIGIVTLNRAQQRIRAEEAREGEGRPGDK